MDSCNSTLRSSIHTPLMRLTLWRGTILAGVGVSFWVISAIFFTPEQLQKWGWVIFLLGLALITWGLLPYRRLRNLELNPYSLMIEEGRWLHFSAKGELLFSLPLSDIRRYAYIEKGNDYGIGLWLKNPLSEKIAIHSKNFDFEKYRKRSLRHQNCEIFLPYFSKRSFQVFSDSLRV